MEHQGGGLTRFDEGSSSSSPIPTNLHPLAPRAAYDWFRKLIPRLRLPDLDHWEQRQEHDAFTLAVATEQTLLERVQEVIANVLATGREVSVAPRAIGRLLDEAGVSVRNPQYAEMVTRTNLMTAMNRGAFEEMRDPDVADTFPVWRYDAILDGRERPKHGARNGKYFPSAIAFHDVRGNGIADAANCRCTFTPMDKWKWAELQSKGAVLETTW